METGIKVTEQVILKQMTNRYPFDVNRQLA